MTSEYIQSLIQKRKYTDVDEEASSDTEEGEEYEDPTEDKGNHGSIVDQVREARRKREAAALALSKSKLPATKENKTSDTRRYFNVEDRRTCKICKKIGHIMKDCPEQMKQCVVCQEDHNPIHCPLSSVCHNCFYLGHRRDECRNPKIERRCMYCDMINHTTAECPMVWRLYQWNDDASMAQPGFSRYCYNCGRKGHLGDDCPENNHNDIPDFYWHSAFRMNADAPPAHLGNIPMSKRNAETMDDLPTNHPQKYTNEPEDHNHTPRRVAHTKSKNYHDNVDNTRYRSSKEEKTSFRHRSDERIPTESRKDLFQSKLHDSERRESDRYHENSTRNDDSRQYNESRHYEPSDCLKRNYIQQRSSASHQITPPAAPYSLQMPKSYAQESPSPPPYPVHYASEQTPKVTFDYADSDRRRTKKPNITSNKDIKGPGKKKDRWSKKKVQGNGEDASINSSRAQPAANGNNNQVGKQKKPRSKRK